MSSNRQWDSVEFNDLDFPYNLVQRELSETPRLVAGQNSYATYGGKLVKRPGTIQVDSGINTTLAHRLDRLWLYETLDTPSQIYIVASAFDSISTTWGLYYIRLDAGGSPVWTSAGTLRSVNTSTRPHEAAVSRGLLYVKSYPSAGSGEKLGTVIFDGTGGSPTLKFWGLLGPQVPAHFSGAAPRINEAATNGITSSQTTFHVAAQNTPNLVLWSEDLSNAIWTTPTGATAVTPVANFAAAPNGTTTATKLTGTGVNSATTQSFPTTIGTTYTVSFWVRAASGTQPLWILLQDSAFGTISHNSVVASTTWTRLTVSGVATTTTSYLTVGGGNSLNATNVVWVWGTQAEKAASAGTYYRTSGPFGYPAAPFNIQIDSELCTVTAFNTGTGVATVLRGAQGTVSAAHADKALAIYRDWATSLHPGAVNVGWAYTYAYKTITGHISNRAPLETNPDLMPSDTGPFLNLVPKLNLQGTPDTTNVPTIVVYRSTDGGGSYMKLSETPNLGDFPISYLDTTLTSTSGGLDPVPDSSLNSQDLAPSLTTNSPPTTVIAPQVIGTDTPAPSTAVVSYSGRFWIAIGNVVSFSANEEINNGVPEESWPTGLYGNFYKFQHPVTNLISTTDALYVVTTQTTYQITGTNKETFNPRPLLEDIGGAQGHPRAITRYGDAIVWLTNDLRIAILQNTNFRTISEPLGADYINLINTKSAEIDLKYFADLEKEWIVLTAICPTPSDTRTWVYDISKSTKLKNDFWNTPWSIPASAVLSGRLRETQQQRRLAFFAWNGTSGFLTRAAVGASEAVGTDVLPGPVKTTFPLQIRTNLFKVPPGDHINALRRPGVLPIVHHFVVERTVFPGDVDPTTVYYLNDLWTNPRPTSLPNDPSRDDAPSGYKTMIFPINLKGLRVGLEFNKNDTDLFEIQNLALTWNTDGGSGI